MKPVSLVDRIKEEKNRGSWDELQVLWAVSVFLVEKNLDYSFLNFLKQRVADSLDRDKIIEELSV